MQTMGPLSSPSKGAPSKGSLIAGALVFLAVSLASRAADTQQVFVAQMNDAAAK